MISVELRKRRVFRDSEVQEMKRKLAVELIEESAADMVVALRTIEISKVMDRAEAEKLVIENLEWFENRYYSMSDEEFQRYIDEL